MRLFGHPLHPLLVAFPIGLLALVPVWDFLSWSGLLPEATTVAYWSEIAGLVAGGLAAVPGFVDFTRLPAGAMVDTALKHAGLALLALSLFGVALALRGRGVPVSTVVLALDGAGAACLAGAGWFGGHLVFHYGAGVEAAASNGERRPD